MADAREESSEDSFDSTSSDNFSIYTESSSSEEDLQNVEEPGKSTSSATTHNSRKGKSKSSSKQPTVKRSKRQQSFFVGKAYLKINSLVKTPLHEFMAVARSGLWAPTFGKPCHMPSHSSFYPHRFWRLHIVVKPLKNIYMRNYILCWSVTPLMFIQTLHSWAVEWAGRIGDFGNFFSGFAKSPRVLRSSSWILNTGKCNLYFKIVKYYFLSEDCMIKTAPHSTVSPQMWCIKSMKGGWFKRPQIC